MEMKTRCLVILSVLSLVLAACGSPAPSSPIGTDTPLPQPSPTSPQAPTQSATPPSAQRKASPLPTPGPVEDIVEAATAHLAEQLDIPPQEVEALSAMPVEWQDTSLGCPEPGKVYAQVVTPGYKAFLKAEGERYEVHMDRGMEHIVICERSLEEGPAAAVEYLADQLDVSSEKIEVLIVEPAEWPDTGLGCPDPDKSYAQVVTQGYQILLEVEGKRYEIHTDRSGKNVVICR